MRSDFLRSGAIYTLANVLTAGVPFLLLPILTRALDPHDYGEVVSFYILVTVTTAIAGLGLNAAVGVRWLDRSKGDPRSYTKAAILLATLTTTATAIVAGLIGPSVGLELPRSMCALAAVVAGATTIQNMRFAVWQSCRRPVPAATLQVSSALLNMALSLSGVLVIGLGGAGRILGATAAGVLVAIYSATSLLRESAAARVSAEDFRRLLRFGLPLVPHALAGALLANADRFAVSARLGSAALGVYGAAAQLGMVLNVLADAAVKAYVPTVYRLLARDSMRDRLSLVGVTYLSIPAWLVLAVAGWAAILIGGGLLLAPDYRSALNLSVWFLLGGALTGIYFNFSALFFFSGKTEWISVATLTACAFALIVAPLAVKHFGILGGAGTYVAGQCVLMIAAWALSAKVKPLPWAHPALAIKVLRHRWRRAR